MKLEDRKSYYSYFYFDTDDDLNRSDDGGSSDLTGSRTEGSLPAPISPISFPSPWGCPYGPRRRSAVLSAFQLTVLGHNHPLIRSPQLEFTFRWLHLKRTCTLDDVSERVMFTDQKSFLQLQIDGMIEFKIARIVQIDTVQKI
jgi:hypothetical protein